MGRRSLEDSGRDPAPPGSWGIPSAVSDLALLSEMARTVGSSLTSRGAMDYLAKLALHASSASRARIETVSAEGAAGSSTLAAASSDPFSVEAELLGHGLLRWIHAKRLPFLSNDPGTDARLPGEYPRGNPRNILCVPMLVRGEVMGLLSVFDKRGGEPFTPRDQHILSVLASQAAQVLENDRLRAEESILLAYREELDVASRIQCELLPRRCPDLRGYDVCSLNIPARTVGGDYFDFIDMGGGRHAVCIGDVCGKGLPAALLMANLQAIVRTQTLNEPPGPECAGRCFKYFDEPARQCVERCNRLIQKCTTPERFVTLFYGILDWERHSITFSNAGHNPPLLCRAGEVRRLRMGGIPLGIEVDWSYHQEAVDLEPGDLIVLYSDGITEARDLDGEEFGEERILSTIRGHCSRGMEDVLESVRVAVGDHLGGAPQVDDMTLVLLRRHAPGRAAGQAS